MKPVLTLAAMAALALLSFCAPLPAVQASHPDPLYWAALLASHVNEQNTGYRHKETSVHWGQQKDGSAFECYTDCSGFINSLFSQAYGWGDSYFKTWLGRTRPLACNYYDAIMEGNHFQVIRSLQEVRPGDLIAIKYQDRSEHEDNSGHCLLVAARPAVRQPTVPELPGTTQYEVLIYDCSKSPHGKSDSRHRADGSPYDGLGKGLLRLYADGTGKPLGYSWSTGRPRAGFDPQKNPLVIGRLDPNLK